MYTFTLIKPTVEDIPGATINWEELTQTLSGTYAQQKNCLVILPAHPETNIQPGLYEALISTQL